MRTINDENSPPQGEPTATTGAGTPFLLLGAAILGGFLLRLATWSRVFADGATWFDGPDAYYHLRRAWLTLQTWPFAPQTDMMIGAPEGGPISWPPFFDLLLATLALPWRTGSVEAFERVAAWLPPVLGVLEIALLFVVVRRLLGPLAAGWSALVAAVLPGVSRYSLLGALDHDPLIESMSLVALYGLIGALGRERAVVKDVFWVALGFALLILTWAGSILHLGLFGCLMLALEWPAIAKPAESVGRAPAVAVTVAAGSLIAAIGTLPFVLGSVWTERFAATFIGLSWLHTTALLALASAGWLIAVRARPTRSRAVLLGASALGFLVLLRVAWPAFAAGLTFFGRGEAFLQGIMESQPLFSLFGSFDLRPPVIRLSLLLLLVPVLAPWMLRRTLGDRRLVLVWIWLLYMIALAIVQSRYAHAAALPMALLAGALLSNFGKVVPARFASLTALAVCLLVAVPTLPAYVSVPGLESFQFSAREPKIRATGLAEACDFLRAEAGASESWSDPRSPSSSSVVAPWSAGHWLIWRGRQAVVSTPLGPQGQPAFVDGVRFYLESDPEELRQLLDRRRIRYFVAIAQIPPLESYVRLAGVQPEAFFRAGDGPRLLEAEKYLASAAARLTWIGPQAIELFGRPMAALDAFREVYRSGRTRPNPFAGALPGIAPEAVPVVRIFEVRTDSQGQEPPR